ncbi:MAG: SDR family oxidoreductase [Balneolaceae bacterium]|nr:SDR family oxidoreductase [Balneolaceae bacterium]
MIALVTGAYRGLGLETVKQLAEQKYTVVLTGRNTDKGESAASEFRDQGLDVYFHRLDVNDQFEINELHDYMLEKFGVLDVLVNNAGIHYDTGHDVTNPNWNIVQEAVETNFIGAWKLTVAMLPLIKKSATGRIVNVSSGAGSLQDMSPGTPAYSTSKAAMNVLTIQLAEALKPEGIKVNSVCPGWVRTDMGGQAAPRSVEEGATGIVWAATLNQNGPTGGFFRDGKPIAW